MRFLALDVGEKRIGIAVSDPTGIIAQAHSVWERRQNKEQDYQHIATLCSGYEDLREIVVGLPINMDGTMGIQARGMESFIQDLLNYVSIPITTWDERMTTVSAERVLIAADVSRKKRRQVIDKLAAVYILQAYLDRINYSKE